MFRGVRPNNFSVVPIIKRAHFKTCNLVLATEGSSPFTFNELLYELVSQHKFDTYVKSLLGSLSLKLLITTFSNQTDTEDLKFLLVLNIYYQS